jgi:hypothetical protein
MDALTPVKLVEKRRKGGSEKRSSDGVERKRREKTLDGLLIEASLRGIVEVQSAEQCRTGFSAGGRREEKAMAICTADGFT